MEYVLKESKFPGGTYTFDSDLEGLEIKPKKGKEIDNLKVKKVVVCDEELATNYVNKIYGKKVKELMRNILLVLSNDSSEDGDALLVLDEVAKLKSVIINKYKKFIKEKFYKDAMKKLIIMEEDFKNSYTYSRFFKEEVNEIGKCR